MNLFPKAGKPYYIVAPPYETKSAGVKALHILCHALNLSGYRAYIVPMGKAGISDNYNYITPIALENYDPEKIIAVYPEVLHGNPLNAKHVVRYLLYYIGGYSGPKQYAETDQLWAFATSIAKHANISLDKVLTIPLVDSSIFKPSGSIRSGSCFYANKYRFVYNGKLLDVTKDSTEITQEMSREQIIELLQKSEFLYSYEDTTLILESVLCGCPVIVLPTQHLKQCCGIDDLGRSGIAWGTDPIEIKHAKQTIDQARDDYVVIKDKFLRQLEKFIADTQNYRIV